MGIYTETFQVLTSTVASHLDSALTVLLNAILGCQGADTYGNQSLFPLEKRLTEKRLTTKKADDNKTDNAYTIFVNPAHEPQLKTL